MRIADARHKLSRVDPTQDVQFNSYQPGDNMKSFIFMLALIGASQSFANTCDVYVDSELSNRWFDPQMTEILRAKNYNPILNVYTTAPGYKWNGLESYDATFDPTCGVSVNGSFIGPGSLIGKKILAGYAEVQASPNFRHYDFPGVSLSEVGSNVVWEFGCRENRGLFTKRVSSPAERLQAISELPICN